MIEADAALLATIEQVKADLGAVKKEMESAMAEDVGAAQQQEQHAELRFGGRLQSGRRDAQEGYQRSAAKLETLKAQIAEQDEISSTAIQTLKSVDNTQQEATDISSLITIVGLCIESVALLGNSALLVLLVKKKS